MRTRLSTGALGVVLAATLAAPASGQILDAIEDSAERAVESETRRQVRRAVQNAIRCVVGDIECFEEAEESGEEVVFVDENGNVVTDEDGDPITDPEEARATAPAPAAPGEGVWANYDFVPGDEILFYDDYTDDGVGDFPRRLGFLRGNWEVVEWEGRRLLRASGRNHPAIEVPLPREVPDRFTVEFDAHLPHGNHRLSLVTYSPGADGKDARSVEENLFRFGRGGSGIDDGRDGGVESLTPTDVLMDRIVSIRVMVDGRYVKVFLGTERVANVPNAELRRGDRLYLEIESLNRNPAYVGPIRVAAGGGDLYEDLMDDGRATTRGILFGVNSDRIRGESTPVLERIGTMLRDHPDLRLGIEGHTDADGDEAHNQDLSERRAEAVKSYLVERHGIDSGRLETRGFGESMPVADNRSSEGKQKNRRVELVRL